MNNRNNNQPAGRTWQPFALLEMPYDGMIGDMLASWLREALRPLALPVDFFGKVLNSALDAAASVPVNMRLVRWVIFTSGPQPADDQTWGFFRMVKNGGLPHQPQDGAHEIIFYLYTEDSARPG